MDRGESDREEEVRIFKECKKVKKEGYVNAESREGGTRVQRWGGL